MIDNYEKVRAGHWHQIERTGPGPVYSHEYMEHYNKSPSLLMSIRRYNLICQNMPKFDSVCDFGYGNGSFLEYCMMSGKTCYGYDVSDCPVPVGAARIYDIKSIDVDVMTFFDSLEHIEDADLVPFLQQLKTRYVMISLPWMHETLGSEWFSAWKHRKPNEHFHHFDVCGLVGLLHDSGYETIHVSNDEDYIRKPVDHWPNILSVVAKKL